MDVHLRQEVPNTPHSSLSRDQSRGQGGGAAEVHGSALAGSLYVYRVFTLGFVYGHGPATGYEAGCEGGYGHSHG